MKAILKSIGWMVFVIVLVLGCLWLAGWMIMLLWNMVMPDVFGLIRINVLQALALGLLSTVLIRGFNPTAGRRKKQEKLLKSINSHLERITNSQERQEIDNVWKDKTRH